MCTPYQSQCYDYSVECVRTRKQRVRTGAKKEVHLTQNMLVLVAVIQLNFKKGGKIRSRNAMIG